jgi:MraZ protein
LFGTSEILKVDPEGRVILTESVKVHAGITDALVFVGLGQKFQIWEPQAFRAHLEEARTKVRDLKRALGKGGLEPRLQAVPPGARES